MKNNGKYLYFEVMRIIACFFVIFNHTGKKGFYLFLEHKPGGILFFADLFIAVFCKFSVPLFFAISGALFLARENEPFEVLWKKRIGKIAMVLVVFSLIYYLVEVGMGTESLSIGRFLSRFYEKNWNFSFWYLYAYIPFLMCLPFLRALVKNLSNQHFYYWFGLALVFTGLIPCLQYILCQDRWTLNEHFNAAWLCSEIVLYPCLGYFLQHRFDLTEHRNKLPLLWLVNAAAIGISCFMTYYRMQVTGNRSGNQELQVFYNSFVFINCAAVFLTVKDIFSRIRLSARLEQMIELLGSCTFGIYLLHLMVLKKIPFFTGLWDSIWIGMGNFHMLAAFLICFCVMGICCVLTLLLKKIPVIRYLF
ncbi:MAG: acyltransferase [Lachnospiraceae bacterium]|nr:acyltransferase [Lachnospiraceae bacterium]